MNKRRFLAAALAAGALLAFGQISQVQAGPQAGQNPGGQRQGWMKKMAEDLGLTEDQKAKIKPIMQSQRQQMEALRANTTLTPEAKRAQIKQIRQSTKTQVDAILTPDQQKKLDAMREAAKERREDRAGQ